MRVSRRLDYTVRGLTALAMKEPAEYVAAGDLADDLGLPRRFVEQQFTLLARAGNVDSRRGAGGGCSLARDAADITVADVVRALQRAVIDVPHVTGSAVSEMWAHSSLALESALEKVSLAELAERQRRIDSEAAPMYYI